MGKRSRYCIAHLAMDTVVNIAVVTSQPEPAATRKMEQAFRAFKYVEQVCSRFDAQSEVRRLCSQAGTSVRVSALLFEAVRFACQMAESTAGLFDPTVGARLESYGFNRHYLGGETPSSGLGPNRRVSYRDLLLNEGERSILLRQPLLIDLGAVAKGMAVDLAAKELVEFESFVIDAGGDVYAHGLNERDEPWRLGIRHPQRPDEAICAFQLLNAAICTSGSYERPSPVQPGIYHLIDPRSGVSRSDLLSCSVVAPFAMLADAMSTAAYLMGREQGISYLEENGLDGLYIDSALAMHFTKEMARYIVS